MTLREMLLDTLRPEPEGRWVDCPECTGPNGLRIDIACYLCNITRRVPVLSRLGIVERCPTYAHIQTRSWVDDGMHYWLGRKHHDAATCSGWVLAPSVAALSDELLEALVTGLVSIFEHPEITEEITPALAGWLEENQS